MARRETIDLEHPAGSQVQVDDAVVAGVALTSDEAGRFGTIHEPDGAVVSQQQVLGDVADRWSAWIRVSSHDEE